MIRHYKYQNLRFTMDGCFFRKLLNKNGTELIRAIYPAVRDQNWDTVPLQLINKRIREDGGQFRIENEIHFQKEEIDFKASYIISIFSTGNLSFEFRGAAHSSFKKNRIGLNLLLPIRELAGCSFTIKHPENKEYNSYFPKAISPHQVMVNVSELFWQDRAGNEFIASLEGDIFEMEDQRNWTDASYKIYSTPLNIPFPILMKEGDSVHQKISFRIHPVKPQSSRHLSLNNDQNEQDIYFKLPSIGIGASSEKEILSNGEVDALNKLGLDFLRSHIDLLNKDWEDRLLNHLGNCRALSIKAKISFILPDHFDSTEKLIHLVNENSDIIDSIEFFNDQDFLSKGKVIREIYKHLEDTGKNYALGSGTYAYYAELNRAKDILKPADYITFSISPQVHAFDNLSLIENLEGIGAVVLDSSLKHRLPVDINALTLKQRMNFVASEEKTKNADGNKFPDNLDSRQESNFNATWTLGAISKLIFSGVKSVSLFETLGNKGIMQCEKNIEGIEAFKKLPLWRYPVFFILNEILKHKDSKFKPIYIANRKYLDGFHIYHKKGNTIWIWNYSEIVQKIPFELQMDLKLLKHLNLENGTWVEGQNTYSIPGNSILSFE